MYFWFGVIVAVVSLSLAILSVNPMWLLLLLVSAWCAYQEKTIQALREEERQDRLNSDRERKLALEKRLKRYSDPDWIDAFSRDRSKQRSTMVTSFPSSSPSNTTVDTNLALMGYTMGSTSTDDDDKCRTTQVESGWSSNDSGSNSDSGTSTSFDSSPSSFD